MSKVRAKTEEEVRSEFLDCVCSIVKTYTNESDLTVKDRCRGVAFSILCIFDGAEQSLPAMGIVLQSDEDDKEYYRDIGENWYEAGQMINNSSMLHEEFSGVKYV